MNKKHEKWIKLPLLENTASIQEILMLQHKKSTFLMLIVFGLCRSGQKEVLDLSRGPVVKKDHDKITNIGSIKRSVNFFNYSRFNSLKRINKVQPTLSMHNSNGDGSKSLIQQILKAIAKSEKRKHIIKIGRK